MTPYTRPPTSQSIHPSISTSIMGPCLGKLKSSSSSSPSAYTPLHPSASASASNSKRRVPQELVPLITSQPGDSKPYAYEHLFSGPSPQKSHRERQKQRSDHPSPIKFEHPPGCRCRGCQPGLYPSTWSIMGSWSDRCVAGCRCERCCFIREVEARQQRRLRHER